MSQEVEIVHEAAAAIEATGGIGALGINAKLFIAQLIHFVVVLLIFWKWIYGPVIRLLDKRQETIEKSLTNAKEIEDRVAKLEDERASVIREAKAQANEIMSDAKKAADEQREKMIVKAKDEVGRVIIEGKVRLNQEKLAMLQEAKSDMAKLAVEASKKILEGAVDEKTSQKLAEKVIDENI